MDHGGVGPAPHVGEAMRFLMDIRLDEGIIGEDEVRRRLDAWWTQRS
jgi:poly(A) polymerase